MRRYIYLPYVRELRAAAKLSRAAGRRAPYAGSLRRIESTATALRQAVWHRTVLVVTDAFAF